MLELKNLSFQVDTEHGKKDILKNINLTLHDNELVVITGPNGGGKSTLAKIIMGIEKQTSGQILFNGVDISDTPITERARMGFGFAFQQPVRFKGITVKDLIKLSSQNKDITVDKACAYLSEVGLCAQEYINREVNASLSGGELKRIEIATVLARQTELSIFDEPEAGIDLWSFNNLIDVFQRIHDKHEGSILIISHQERILNVADRIIVIAGGEIQSVGTHEEIMPELMRRADGCGCSLKRGNQ